MLQTLFVLFSGKRFAGKDFQADLLYSQFQGHPQVVRASFAYGVKLAAAEEHGLDLQRLLSDRAYKEEHRAQLMKIASDAREAESAVWVRRLVERLQQDPPRVVIISDWRFPDEFTALLRYTHDIMCYRVETSDERRRARGWIYDSVVDNDISETALDDWPSWPWTPYALGQVTSIVRMMIGD